MNNNLDFLKKEKNIIKNHSIFKLTNFTFEMKVEKEPKGVILNKVLFTYYMMILLINSLPIMNLDYFLKI